MFTALVRVLGPRRVARWLVLLVVGGLVISSGLLLFAIGAMTGAAVTSAAADPGPDCTTTTTTSSPSASSSPSSSVSASSSSSVLTSPVVTQHATWDAAQVEIARVIAVRGVAAGVGSRGVVVALMVGMRESGLRNLDYGDRDSLGVFQHRPSMGWGTPAQIQDVALAADAFYGVAAHTTNPGLTDLPGWQQLSLGDAGQGVQHSGYPTAYAPWEPDARQLAGLLLTDAGTVVDCTGTSGPAVISGAWAHPLAPAPYRATSRFGPRQDPVTGAWRVHHGFDMAAPVGTPIRAACSGVVLSTNPRDRYGGGMQTDLDCGGGVVTIYMHQSAFLVAPGVSVTAGTVIGKVGSTGHSTGPHLHFQVDVDGHPVEPVEFMRVKGIQL